jgi:hypothetical protein
MLEEYNLLNDNINNLVRFDGGLGDIIISCIHNNRWNNIIKYSEHKKIIVSLYTHNLNVPSLFLNTPFSDNIIIYDYLKEGNKWSDIFSYRGAERLAAMERYENVLLEKDKIDFNIDRSLKIFESEKRKMDHFLTYEDQYFIKSVLKYNKPILIVAASASTPDRNLPDHIISDFYERFKNQYTIVQIGFDGSNYSQVKHKPEYRIGKDSIDLINKMSISGNLHLIDLCDGILCSESSMYCYAAFNNKNIITGIKDKNIQKYGFVDKSKRLHYFHAYDRKNVLPFDFINYNKSIFEDFDKVLSNKIISS